MYAIYELTLGRMLCAELGAGAVQQVPGGAENKVDGKQENQLLAAHRHRFNTLIFIIKKIFQWSTFSQHF